MRSDFDPRCGLHAVTLNLGGLRASLRKGLMVWLEKVRPDVVLLQEVRAEPSENPFSDLGYTAHFVSAQKAGYSGVGILSLEKPIDVISGLGMPSLDSEGRVLRAQFPGYSVVSIYAPSGTSGPERQRVKLVFLEALYSYTHDLLKHHEVLVGGDYNIARTDLDLKNWRGNKNRPGCTSEERNWFEGYLRLGLTDAHRALLDGASEYTWWSQRGQAYFRDTGWRIDYQLCTSRFVPLQHRVWREACLSDHAPLGIVYGFS
ncbi:MAG: exodeoxyribonuclease III [Deinococcaceae bacterium]